MHRLLAVVALATLPLLAQSQVKNLGLCERSFEAALEPGSRISMHLRSGEIHISGSAEPRIVVTCEVAGIHRRNDVEVSFMAAAKSADLKVSGGPMDSFRLRIQIPSQTNLLLRTAAGEVTIDNVTGDKDASLTAGQLEIAVGSPHDYSRAEASVHVGDLNAAAWSVQKGGLFRSFKRTNAGGRYYLDAHVGAGDLTLR